MKTLDAVVGVSAGIAARKIAKTLMDGVSKDSGFIVKMGCGALALYAGIISASKVAKMTRTIRIAGETLYSCVKDTVEKQKDEDHIDDEGNGLVEEKVEDETLVYREPQKVFTFVDESACEMAVQMLRATITLKGNVSVADIRGYYDFDPVSITDHRYGWIQADDFEVHKEDDGRYSITRTPPIDFQAPIEDIVTNRGSDGFRGMSDFLNAIALHDAMNGEE